MEARNNSYVPLSPSASSTLTNSSGSPFKSLIELCCDLYERESINKSLNKSLNKNLYERLDESRNDNNQVDIRSSSNVGKTGRKTNNSNQDLVLWKSGDSTNFESSLNSRNRPNECRIIDLFDKKSKNTTTCVYCSTTRHECSSLSESSLRRRFCLEYPDKFVTSEEKKGIY